MSLSERHPCPNLETNRKVCTCPNKGCPRHGCCCACVEHHLAAGKPPLCMRDLSPQKKQPATDGR